MNILLLAGFITAPVIQPLTRPRFPVSGLELSGKSAGEAIEHAEAFDEGHLDYDEMLSLTRQILRDPKVKEIFESEIQRQKREFISTQWRKKAAALTLEDIQKHNKITFSQGDRGPSVTLTLVKKFESLKKIIEFVVYTAFRDDKGIVHIEGPSTLNSSRADIAE
jgi:hypothetical protein